MRGLSRFVNILRDGSKLLCLKLTKLFPNENSSGEKDSGKVLIIIIILFLNIRPFKKKCVQPSYFPSREFLLTVYSLLPFSFCPS